MILNIFKEKKNCRKVCPAQYAGILIDGENYFRALRDAVKTARRQIFIIGWDIHSRMKLTDEDDGYPIELGPFLNAVAQKNPDLKIYLLSWDFAMIYLFEREIFPIYTLDWKTERNITFRLDTHHPLGASQHQKIVVIDDIIAFCGGFDLSIQRWDKRGHPAREDRDGPPFHDLQMAVKGDIAKELGDIARERWYRATRKHVKPVEKNHRESSFFPETPHIFKNLEVAVAQTLPKYKKQPEVREVEALYVDSIKHAESYIYIENQYITSQSAGKALAERLKDENGPEVIIITPGENSGWLEQDTMGVLRLRLFSFLRESDKYGRLSIYYPTTGHDGKTYINIHSKLTIIDDTFIRIGSANLSNRSMGLDSECDLAIVAKTDSEKEQIKKTLNDLLSEHLKISKREVYESLSKSSSFFKFLDKAVEDSMFLHQFSQKQNNIVEKIIPEYQYIDPEKPVSADELLKTMLPQDDIDEKNISIVKIAFPLIILLVLAGLWRWSPLSSYATPEYITSLLEPVRTSPTAPIFSVIGFMLLATFMVPVTALIVVNSVLFGPWAGMITSLTGAAAASLLNYLGGRILWRNAIRKIGGKYLNKLSNILRKKGIFTIAGIRLVPIAPFTVINMIAGAIHINLLHFLVGTIIGMAPAIIALSFFSSSLLNLIIHPSVKTVSIFIVLFVVIIGGITLLSRNLIKNTSSSQNQ